MNFHHTGSTPGFTSLFTTSFTCDKKLFDQHYQPNMPSLNRPPSEPDAAPCPDNKLKPKEAAASAACEDSSVLGPQFYPPICVDTACESKLPSCRQQEPQEDLPKWQPASEMLSAHCNLKHKHAGVVVAILTNIYGCEMADLSELLISMFEE